MTKHQKVVVLRKQIHRDRSILRFWRHHRYLTQFNSAVAQEAKAQTHWARVSLHISSRNLHRLLVVVRPTAGANGRPAHYRGWLCIHNQEGSWQDTGDPYWGGLQMHAGWGYGTSYHASDDSPLVQMWAAEHGYQASGYSRAWLSGQWPGTYPPCAGNF